MPKIVELWRYPLKSARGEPLRSAPVERSGLAGDREWACLDPSDGTVGSAKHPRRWGRLLEVSARSLDGGGLAVRIGGEEYRASATAALSGAGAPRPPRERTTPAARRPGR
ncbi:MOSC N-terminal beta barrel domain-containing protein [Actinoplanes sp. NPDC051513]|uniref:MOSC N-terminal beta barrel domain-containing protein n=1 Tax=Actinoplanes sp. NPDC051513 TaxID=3363908 RepID=UPI00378B08DF